MSLAIDVKNLEFMYAGAEVPVLSGCDWQVPQGAFALLVGATGSGKSTLLSLLKPQIAPAGALAGELNVLGRPLKSYGEAESAKSIGYVFQNPETQVVCESVWHEMAFGLENLGTPQDEMRRLVAETSYFFGMEDWFRAQTDELSGGRKQLLALASTLVMQPKLLLLDEPTAMLDPIAEKNFLHALFRINRELGCTVVVATHRPQAMLDYASCAFSLVDGRLSKLNFDVFKNKALHAYDGYGAGADSDDAAGAMSGTAVSLAQAYFRYERKLPWVLRSMDFSAGRGRVHAVVGGNGCGKSTLLGVLAKTNKLARGKLERPAARTVYLPQNPKALFVAESVFDELMEWSKSAGYDEHEVDDILAKLGLAGCAAQHPYDLSGGQQQLLALGKLLLVKPELLLLDEPTKGLDDAARAQVGALLRDCARQGKAVVMSSHDLAFVSQVAHTTSMMFDGQVACTQPTQDFFKNNVYYRP